jgi:hypothetical protein
MKKETLEEAAEKYAMETYGSIEFKDYTPEMKLNYARLATAYKQGSEWQQEQNGLTMKEGIDFGKELSKWGYNKGNSIDVEILVNEILPDLFKQFNK